MSEANLQFIVWASTIEGNELQLNYCSISKADCVLTMQLKCTSRSMLYRDKKLYEYSGICTIPMLEPFHYKYSMRVGKSPFQKEQLVSNVKGESGYYYEKLENSRLGIHGTGPIEDVFGEVWMQVIPITIHPISEKYFAVYNPYLAIREDSFIKSKAITPPVSWTRYDKIDMNSSYSFCAKLLSALKKEDKVIYVNSNSENKTMFFALFTELICILQGDASKLSEVIKYIERELSKVCRYDVELNLLDCIKANKKQIEEYSAAWFSNQINGELKSILINTDDDDKSSEEEKETTEKHLTLAHKEEEKKEDNKAAQLRLAEYEFKLRTKENELINMEKAINQRESEIMKVQSAMEKSTNDFESSSNSINKQIKEAHIALQQKQEKFNQSQKELIIKQKELEKLEESIKLQAKAQTENEHNSKIAEECSIKAKQYTEKLNQLDEREAQIKAKENEILTLQKEFHEKENKFQTQYNESMQKLKETEKTYENIVQEQVLCKKEKEKLEKLITEYQEKQNQANTQYNNCNIILAAVKKRTEELTAKEEQSTAMKTQLQTQITKCQDQESTIASKDKEIKDKEMQLTRTTQETEEIKTKLANQEITHKEMQSINKEQENEIASQKDAIKEEKNKMKNMEQQIADLEKEFNNKIKQYEQLITEKETNTKIIESKYKQIEQDTLNKEQNRNTQDNNTKQQLKDAETKLNEACKQVEQYKIVLLEYEESTKKMNHTIAELTNANQLLLEKETSQESKLTLYKEREENIIKAENRIILIETKEKDIGEREKKLTQKENNTHELEQSLISKEKSLSKKDSMLNEKEQSINKKDKAVTDKEIVNQNIFNSKEAEYKAKLEVLSQRENKVAEDNASIMEKTENLAKQETEFQQKKQKLEEEIILFTKHKEETMKEETMVNTIGINKIEEEVNTQVGIAVIPQKKEYEKKEKTYKEILNYFQKAETEYITKINGIENTIKQISGSSITCNTVSASPTTMEKCSTISSPTVASEYTNVSSLINSKKPTYFHNMDAKRNPESEKDKSMEAEGSRYVHTLPSEEEKGMSQSSRGSKSFANSFADKKEAYSNRRSMNDTEGKIVKTSKISLLGSKEKKESSIAKYYAMMTKNKSISNQVAAYTKPISPGRNQKLPQAEKIEPFLTSPKQSSLTYTDIQFENPYDGMSTEIVNLPDDLLPMTYYCAEQGDPIDKMLGKVMENYFMVQKYLPVVFRRIKQGLYNFAKLTINLLINNDNLYVKKGGGLQDIIEFLKISLPIEAKKTKKLIKEYEFKLKTNTVDKEKKKNSKTVNK